MERVLDVAFYVCKEYSKKMHRKIDEIKLHQLLYFAQRESLVQTERPLFEEEFQGWKFGPVCIPVRKAYRSKQFWSSRDFTRIGQHCKSIVDKVLKQYGCKDSWSLSDIMHFEYSWTQSRTGLKDDENGSRSIVLDDIKVDAKRIHERREALTHQDSGNSNGVLIPIISSASIEEPEPMVDVVAEIKKIQRDLRRRNHGRQTA